MFITQYKDASGTEHLDCDQVLSVGLKATTEARALDWQLRPHSDAIFGEVEGRSRYVDPRKLEPGLGAERTEFLAAGWEGAEQVQSWVRNESSGWTAIQIWGFRLVDGQRRYCRKVCVTRSGSEEKRQALLVYDWVGPL